jgi:hypothetical protein
MDDKNLQGPLSPYEREQARLIRAYNERLEQEKKQVEALKDRVIDEHGIRFQQLAKQLGAYDEPTQKLAAEFISKEVAEKKIEPHLVNDFHVEVAVDKAIAAQELKQAQEAEKYKADKEQTEQARAAETLKRQEQEKQVEAHRATAQEAARQEPIPGSMQRFAAMFAERDAQREAEALAQKGRINNADLDRANEFAQGRPNHARHNDLKQENTRTDGRGSGKAEERETPKGEMTDARAARFAKMFEKPSSDRVFDPTHDPSNQRNFANGRGGRER